MKRSEFALIVNTVADEELQRLNADVQEASKNDDHAFATIIAQLAASIPAITARTTAEILVRSGVIRLEPESDS